MMRYIVDFFEFVLKKDHEQRENLLFKERKKYEEKLKKIKELKPNDVNYNKKRTELSKIKFNLDNIRSTAKQKLIPEWICAFSEKAKSVAKQPFIWSSHINKFTNASNNYESLDSDQYQATDKQFVSTSSIKAKTYDLAHSNGNQINFSRFLIIKDEKKETLFEKIIREDTSWLDMFFNDLDKKKNIVTKLKTAITKADSRIDPSGLKQIYFPVNGHEYHLIAPIFSSIFCQYLFDTTKARDEKKYRISVKKNQGNYSEYLYIGYPKLGIIIMGGEKPHNISPLNSARFGQVPLLRTCPPPPQWQTQSKPPVNSKTIFNKKLCYCAQDQDQDPLHDLKNLMLEIKSNSLSVNLQRKKIIIDLISEVANTVFDYVAEIQNMKTQAGWSQESKLPMHQQYWLDPYRKDEAFQTERQEIDWQSDVLNDFARWINWRVKHKSLTLGIPHEEMWKKILRPLLREFNAITKADVQYTASKGEK